MQINDYVKDMLSYQKFGVCVYYYDENHEFDSSDTFYFLPGFRCKWLDYDVLYFRVVDDTIIFYVDYF